MRPRPRCSTPARPTPTAASVRRSCRLPASAFGDTRNEADSRSFTYLASNGDGTYGLATETHMTFAPISLLQTDPAAPPPVVIEILGEWVFRAVATGKPGGSSITLQRHRPVQRS